jgi:glutaminyl-peptide cyclotransferase
VAAAGAPLGQLNELECVEGQVYANVYGTDRIARIDPTSGRVTAMIDASGLLTPAESARAEVLNGIAYNSERGTFYLTGKLWPRLFEVTFEPVAKQPGETH